MSDNGSSSFFSVSEPSASQPTLIDHSSNGDDADVDTLAELVDGESGRMLSPYVGLDSPISLQSWNHQLKVDSVDDERVEQFADFMTFNRSPYGDDSDKNEALAFPEPGASCENPAFAAEPLVEGDQSSPVGPSDAPSSEEQG